jgi:alkyl hydroperoxide reductase subunit AhpC
MVIGRNVEDYMRLLDAKDYFEKTGNVCPANWRDKISEKLHSK